MRRTLSVIILILVFVPILAFAQMSEDEYHSHVGTCPCPYSINHAGNLCGKTSAWCRTGGYSPSCDLSKIPQDLILYCKASSSTTEITEEDYLAHVGPCPCPYNMHPDGYACGRRSAWHRGGGYKPLCDLTLIHGYGSGTTISEEEYLARVGPCPCPYNIHPDGTPCHKRSAWSKPEGYSPVCDINRIQKLPGIGISEEDHLAGVGPCACPYNLDSNGNLCGTRSAWCQSGGYSPACALSRIPHAIIRECKHHILY